jgi:pyridinium-3,5-bisthiocarboxylic acid mononucleotide nickel chelatase
MIAASSLTDRAKELAQRIFLRLAEAEAKAHQVAVDQVQFHEVGAVDSIVDIVGTAIGLDYLAIENLYCSAVPLGGGFVETAHGRLPVPAPATAELLKGLAVHTNCGTGERVTPTGAAILAALAEPGSSMPEMTIKNIGHGAGSKDFADCPNILRGFLGELSEQADHETVLELSCNLDDVTPELLGYTMEQLFTAGRWMSGIRRSR